ncbi:anti-anti-sigma regulatory factor [Vibrio coralliilyticus]|jgi:anti-anti-sigma factor|uniref:Anti-anti-sigma regulatory factor n=1 Tax=Vibrio coralliilyticus TaxID=190893 RepID=A0A097AZN8_9VIBR|nr:MULTISPECIES: STAS domain-containing protein [Vibrio]AIS57882.1 anti-anti-sigma regulatory factor [Vibrio coralliilyticus]AIW22157.1 anti-anti-sigma regulatory factor [Vibrio coralliilyticus]ANW26614.1 anti-anti-sigma factor [Vibrio coralliilyticus]ARC94021.1 anti-anti-sigma factor [Vibrio coralliilyticus]AXN33852.1 anti-sigma factor antagonist [Vibrio coralliilyticus]
MSVEAEVDSNSKQVTILIEGAFGFNLVQEFRRCYSDKKDFRFTIDLRKVDYIDSAGLGMLLNMHNYLEQDDGMIRITNTLPQVRKILTISRFDKKFSIE